MPLNYFLTVILYKKRAEDKVQNSCLDKLKKIKQTEESTQGCLKLFKALSLLVCETFILMCFLIFLARDTSVTQTLIHFDMILIFIGVLKMMFNLRSSKNMNKESKGHSTLILQTI